MLKCAAVSFILCNREWLRRREIVMCAAVSLMDFYREGL